MNFLDCDKSLIENLYFISGPIIALIGLFVIFQIRIAKKQLAESQKQLLINSQRNAATISAEQVKIFCEVIIPLENKIFFEKQKIFFPKFKGEIKNFTNDEFMSWDKEYRDSFMKKPDTITLLELDLLNRLEAFSIYFIQKIADEKIAFTSIGNAFCRSIKDSYPLLSYMRGNKNPNKSWENSVNLYKIWEKRLDSFKLEKQEEDLSNELSKNLEKLEELRLRRRIKPDEIKPIGT